MKATTIREIKFKNGEVWPVGTEVSISVEEERPSIAFLDTLTEAQPKRVRSTSLHLWFNEFVTITEEGVENAMFDGNCPSLTGEEVEPDGWDSEGFPSVLLALNII